MLCISMLSCLCFFFFFFFFQAEDGIRDLTVTGVQTCALPIYVELKVAQGQQFVAGGSIGAGHGEGDVAQAAHGAAAVAVAARLDVELAARDKGAAAVAEAARGVDVDLAGRAALAIDRALVAETRALDADVLAQQVGTVAVADRAEIG